MEDSSKKADSKKGIDDQSEEKFRALYIRYQIADGGYPVRISHSKAQKGKKGDATWKFPDVVVLKPSVEGLERIEDKEDVDFSPFLNLMPLFGKPPLVVSSVELKVTPMTAQLRSYFFEAVSNSMWAQKPLLVFAYSADAQSASELRRLGASYGVTVQTFGLKRNALDNLPSANEIRNWAPEKAREWVEQNSEGIDTLSSPPERPGLDWEHLLDLIVSTGTPFKDVLTWIQKCLTDGKPCHYEEWEKTNKKKKVF